jgi:hypothetical protein
MSDLAFDADVGRLLTAQLASGNPLFIVCHGPAAMLATRIHGVSPFKGHRVTGFTNKEEEGVGVAPRATWLLETDLKEKVGVDFSSGEAWKPYVVEDRNLAGTRSRSWPRGPVAQSQHVGEPSVAGRELQFSTSARSGVVAPHRPAQSDEILRIFGPTWRSTATVRLLRCLASWLWGDPAGSRVGSWCRRCASRWPAAGQRRSSMALPRRPFGSPVVPESWCSERPKGIGCTLAKTAGSAFFSTTAHGPSRSTAVMYASTRRAWRVARATVRRGSHCGGPMSKASKSTTSTG